MSETFPLDQLTGLLTRSAFDDQFEAILKKASETGASLSVAFLDIDHFKQINDTHGHSVGDQVLQEIATILQEVVGDGACMARYGGDEFILVFPGTEREQVFLILEQVRREVENRSIFGGANIQLTITAGISAYPIDGNNRNEIFRKADQALYRAKKAGRNSVKLAYEEKMAPKTVHFTLTQLERLAGLSETEGVGEAVLLREALDDLLLKYGTNEIESE